MLVCNWAKTRGLRSSVKYVQRSSVKYEYAFALVRPRLRMYVQRSSVNYEYAFALVRPRLRNTLDFAAGVAPNDIYRFDAANNTWVLLSVSGTAAPPRYKFGCTVTPNGVIYIFGGYGNAGERRRLLSNQRAGVGMRIGEEI